MDKDKGILIGIAVLVIVLIAVTAFIIATDSNNDNNIANETNKTNNTNNTTVKVNNVTKNNTAVGDNSKRNDTNNTNVTYKVYNPQSDSYVEVIGEKYDADVDRWYTYDKDGVRYYNTRIK